MKNLGEFYRRVDDLAQQVRAGGDEERAGGVKVRERDDDEEPLHRGSDRTPALVVAVLAGVADRAARAGAIVA